MSKYKLNSDAKSELIRIHQYGIWRFGIAQADSYIDDFFEYFIIIAIIGKQDLNPILKK